eukprot:COSAG04_NODE_5709_length_1517_cov_1.419605_1_plen_79_part_00
MPRTRVLREPGSVLGDVDLAVAVAVHHRQGLAELLGGHLEPELARVVLEVQQRRRARAALRDEPLARAGGQQAPPDQP